MKVASVVVDVPAFQTDRPFDYMIPEPIQGLIRPGARVTVPFGNRKVQGFVIAIKETTEIEKLKAIDELLDVVPVLTEELLQLGFWLTRTTLCFAISAFQVMLPAAIKASYTKYLHVKENNLPDEVLAIFDGKEKIDLKDIEPQSLYILQPYIVNGALEVTYEVKDKGRKKTERVIALSIDKEEAALEREQLKAEKQKDVLSLFLQGRNEIQKKEILNQLQITDSPIKALIKKGILEELEKEVYRDPYAERNFVRTEPFPLKDEQAQVLQQIDRSITLKQHDTFLLHGVTGSGKTEVYMQAIERILNEGKEAIVLVPEIALTPQMVHRFKGRFGSMVAVMHSALSVGEKYDEWRKIHRKEVRVVVGARSAIFAPFENLGIIIIDEEHESSYKQEESPRYHARDVAIKRGEYHNCPVVLGSATPALESFARAKKDVYKLLTMKKRMNEQSLPEVEIIDMREELRSGNRSMFSALLHEKIIDRLEKQEQTVLFLNRRGHSTFVMCRDCGYVMECPHCDISLTYHKNKQRVKCHYCNHEETLPSKCPMCEGEHIRFFGTGTQKVEEELTKVFPTARIIRMDVDTTSKKGSHEKLLTQFGEGKADILLGTQMIAKGLDFPNVTLVGVLAADTMLHLPDFRASEKTYQLLTQVSGRAGRHHLPGEVVVQSYTPEHYSIQLTSEGTYTDFFHKEMSVRRLHQYPPYYYITLVTVSHPELMKVVHVTEKITAYLRGKCGEGTIILGPSASAIPRIKDRYRYQCMIKYKHEPQIQFWLQTVQEQYRQELKKDGLQIVIDFNPTIMM